MNGPLKMVHRSTERSNTMAKNDYPVIVYQILSYLYKCLKNGDDVQGILLNYDSPMFDKINKKYWEYIMHNLVKYNLIEGIIEVNVDGKPTPYITGLENCMITPKGIEYLTDNSFLSKAKEFLKDVREIVPFSV